mmetsp:Transcript_19567/g.40849  ORF Transcript_19567/g.40849 Transcript_19567/m.40849 type:complete len:346 (-) Transcript_19567:41-1078(-)|eukprot:CAMPEP_0118643884 /NCGR_PEP_ID=MMETSP0785-20121206/6628_1 /TAXON_ID=91992 /ORGANISM="Bolidomonas pacifica, Strain CCMP 1866" /LENGTH=345 /DNA_ID=CAMNT_0006535575 /DNA_START=60 /DNA_END=1097 /DNA_ORIENTATION=-
MYPTITIFLLLSILTVSTSISPFGIPNGGGLFGGKGSSASTSAPLASDAGKSIADGATKTYPPMSEEEVTSILDDIPIYSITDSTGQGVVLKNPTTGSSIFYFYVSPGMANATMGELKKSNPSLDLQITAYRLGQVYFKILKNSTTTSSDVKLVKGDKVESSPVSSSVDYRLVPDTRDLIGARMLLTMSSKDGEELEKAGGMTQEIAQKTIKRAMTESEKFNSTYNEIPVFMIQQMRIQTKATPSNPSQQMLPMYFSLSDMVGVWQEFANQDDKAKGQEPAIHLMELDELVSNMMAGGEIDFRSILLMGASGKEPTAPPGMGGGAGVGMTQKAGMGNGEQTLGDL